MRCSLLDLNPGAGGGQNESQRGTLKRLPKGGASTLSPTCPEDTHPGLAAVVTRPGDQDVQCSIAYRREEMNVDQYVEEMNG